MANQNAKLIFINYIAYKNNILIGGEDQLNIYKIFKREIALELIQQGNNLIYTEPNRNKTWFSVFCFENTEKLHSDLSTITKHNN